MKIKIVSDGSSKGTKVVNAEMGEEVEGVCSVAWCCHANSRIAKAHLTFVGVPVELVAEVEAPANGR